MGGLTLPKDCRATAYPTKTTNNAIKSASFRYRSTVTDLGVIVACLGRFIGEGSYRKSKIKKVSY